MNENYLMWLNWILWTALSNVSIGVFALPAHQQHPLTSRLEDVDSSPMVFILSLDGFRREYLTMADSLGLKIPNIRRLMRQGATANGTLSVYPALTYPAHTSMITGMYPDRHGIWENEKFDPEQQGRGLYIFAPDVTARTVFDAAFANGLTTSAVNWPVTAFSPSLTYSLPDLPTRTAVENDFSFYGCIQSALFKSQIRDAKALKAINDTDRLNLALSVLRLPNKTDEAAYPRLQALHLIDFDHAEHVYGAFSPEALDMLELEDGLVGAVMDEIDQQGLTDRMNFLLVSDHGFANISQFVAPNVLLKSQGLLSETGNSWRVYTYNSPGVFAIYINTNLPFRDQMEIQEQIASLINFLNDDRFGIAQAYIGYRTIREARLRGYPDAYAILEAKIGWSFSPNQEGLMVFNNTMPMYRASHGYNPNNSEMLTNFIARGPTIKKNVIIPQMSLVDIAPTISHLLKLNMTGMQGRVLRNLFVPN